MTSSDASAWTCTTCGAEHRGLATVFGSDAPWNWHVAGAAERDAGELTADVCFLPDPDPEVGTHFFLRGHVELPLREPVGDASTFVWSVWVSPALPGPEQVKQTLEQIALVHSIVERYPETFALARTAADVRRIHKSGRIASLIGVEGGGQIDNSLAVLRAYHDLGAGYLTLTHSRTIEWADSATDDPKHDGLTAFGESVVLELNRLGMLVDLSHVSEATMLDALDIAKAPVIFSHSGARAIDGHPRNVPDAVLGRLKANGGIVMVVTLPSYVSEEVRGWNARYAGEKGRIEALRPGDPKRAAAETAAWVAANPPPRATVAQVADHIGHIVERAGIDHVGLGGDFDGMDNTVAGMEDVSSYPALFTELARRGYSQADLEKIASRNMLRVMRAAERHAAELRGKPALENPTAF